MNLIDRIKNYFSRENFKSDPELVSFSDLEPSQSPVRASEVKPVASFSPPTVVATPMDSNVIPSPISSMPPERSEYLDETPAETKSWVFTPPATPVEWPAWLEDETLLRDEGVIFGLSESKPEEKVAIIKNYFVHQTAGLEREVERHGEKIQELNLFIEQKENRINELKEKTYQLENRRPEGEHYLLRTVVGTIFSVAMCVGNYFLIDDTLRPLYPNSQWIAIGVFLAGMFNLFGRVSFFHDTDSPVSWRRGLEEVGMPFAAALFVFVQALQNQNLVRAGALFVFVFFLFLFAGKLLLSNMTVLRNDLRIWLTGSSLKKEKISKTENWDTEIARLTTEIDEVRIQKWQILPHLNRAEAELARVNARRDALIKMFESEFNLARQFRERLTDRQMKDIHSSLNQGQ